ncbi:hypothetical protein GALMADRAFT_235375 [Galerina marginata CBS 339.88]|uniref:Uncharacterized protein n=1 Tax=Galerina marginata (strain CBS 339.88) TaxID=685588 RepID=A0A067U1H7_GALM3|nr:hypothetical protein GALMADRAFT_235375 [Galerina marginata CBS 339.88]
MSSKDSQPEDASRDKVADMNKIEEDEGPEPEDFDEEFYLRHRARNERPTPVVWGQKGGKGKPEK